MPKTRTDKSPLDNEAKITLELLNMVSDDAWASQRSMAENLGIALGLANAYLKRCVKKGLIKVRQAPANRYAYYLTPQGFTEKSRLTAEYLYQSFNLFRHARAEGAELLRYCAARGWNRISLYGIGDLTEIFMLSAMESTIELVSVIHDGEPIDQFAGLPVTNRIPSPGDIDAIIICNINDPQGSYDKVTAAFPRDHVLAFEFFRIVTHEDRGKGSG